MKRFRLSPILENPSTSVFARPHLHVESRVPEKKPETQGLSFRDKLLQIFRRTKAQGNLSLAEDRR
jgi:hypothetical protein